MIELDLPRTQISERFREVRSFLSFVKTLESTETPPVDSIEVKALRGLFYVHLYGALEQSLNEVLESFLQAISELELCNHDFDISILPTVMNAQFKSLSDVQGQKKWQKRVDFVSAISGGNPSKIENTVFSPLLQSAEIKTISNIVSYIGISPREIQESNDRHYVDEVVQKRHQVAHGRASPAAVGASRRTDELEPRLEAIWRIVDLFSNILEQHFKTLSFLTEDAKIRMQAK